jgi:hypothetical protein
MRVLAHRNRILPPVDGQPQPDPTKGVVDEISERDNMTALVNQLDLVTKWEASRPPVMRLKDGIFTRFFGPLPEAAKVRSVIGMVEKSLSVNVDQDSFTVSADWSDGQGAVDLVNAAYKNFLDSRYKSEVSVFSERLRVMEMRAQLSAQSVDDAIAELAKQMQTVALDKARASAPVAVAGGPPVAVPRPGNAPDASGKAAADFEQARTLESVRAQIRGLEDERHRRLAEAQERLSDAQSSLGPLNPTVIALQQKLEAAQKPSPELQALQAQEKALIEQLTASVPADPTKSSSAAPAPAPAPGAAFVPHAAAPVAPELALAGQLRELINGPDDPGIAYRKSKLSAASSEYNDVLSRTDLAKVELEVAREAFRNTYTVARPAEVPSKPSKPKVPLILGGGLFAALLLAFLIPGLRDLATRRLIEVWQVEVFLKVPVLGEMTPSVIPPPPT